MTASEPAGPGPRANLVIALICAAIGGLLMLGSVLQSGAHDRIVDAPVCTDEQVFTASRCRAVRDGTVVSLTNDRVELNVDGRPVVMYIRIVGKTSGNEGVPVRVTFYDGEPIHIEGSSLKIDGGNTPTRESEDFFMFGLFFLFFSGVNVLIWLGRRG